MSGFDDRFDRDHRFDGMELRYPAGLRVATALLAVLLAWLAFVIAKAAARDGEWLAGLVIVLLLFAAFAPKLLPIFRHRILVTREELVVGRTFTTYRFRWDEIDRAEAGYAGISLYLRNGKHFVADAKQTSNFAQWRGTHTSADDVAALITRRARAAG